MSNEGQSQSSCDGCAHCRLDVCHKAHLHLHQAILEATSEQGPYPRVPDSLQTLITDCGCCDQARHFPPCLAFWAYAVGELIGPLSRNPERDSWDKLASFMRNVLKDIDKDLTVDVSQFFEKLLKAFRDPIVTYTKRADIIRSFNTIGELYAVRNDENFWACLNIFLAWCEAAADVLDRETKDYIQMTGALVDVWSQLLKRFGKRDERLVYRVVDVAPKLFSLLTRTCKSPQVDSDPRLLAWSSMMRQFERSEGTDGFKSILGSVGVLHWRLVESLRVLREFKWKCNRGEWAKQFAVLIPLLEGRKPAPDRHVPWPNQPIYCEIVIAGHTVDAEIVEFGVENHCGLVVRCEGIQLERAYDRPEDSAGLSWRGFTLRRAFAFRRAGQGPAEVHDMRIKFSAGYGFDPFHGQFGVIRAWPCAESKDKSEWAVLASGATTVPKSFEVFVNQLPLGRHRAKT